MRRPRLLLLGLPYFGQLLAGLLRERGWDARFAHHPGRDPRAWARLVPLVARTDVLYLVGSRIDRGSPQDWLMRLRRRPTVIHWVGTDVLIAQEESARGRLSRRIAQRAIHWADAPWLVDELAALGVRAEHVPLPIPGLAQACPPLSAQFRVLLYLPVDAFDREVFDMKALLRLPRELPAVEFVLIPSPAATLPGPLPPNLEARAWVEDMDALYREVSAGVRLTSHDGTSFMVAELLSRGRHALWTFPFDGATRVAALEDTVAALKTLAEQHAAGTLALLESEAAAIRQRFDPARLAAELDARLRTLTPTPLPARRERGSRTPPRPRGGRGGRG